MSRTLLFALALFAMFAMAAPARADIIAVSDLVRIADDGGDTNASANGGMGGTFIITGPADSWKTFCLEVTEFLTFGPTYYVGDISDGAINGGLAGGNPDILDFKTKAIYHHFRTTVSGWSGADVQNAIWLYEQELANVANPVTQWAAAQDPNAYDFGGHDVKVINLWSARTGGNAQDLLMMQAVPEPVSLLLLGTGLLGLAAVRRRRMH